MIGCVWLHTATNWILTQYTFACVNRFYSENSASMQILGNSKVCCVFIDFGALAKVAMSSHWSHFTCQSMIGFGFRTSQWGYQFSPNLRPTQTHFGSTLFRFVFAWSTRPPSHILPQVKYLYAFECVQSVTAVQCIVGANCFHYQATWKSTFPSLTNWYMRHGNDGRCVRGDTLAGNDDNRALIWFLPLVNHLKCFWFHAVCTAILRALTWLCIYARFNPDFIRQHSFSTTCHGVMPFSMATLMLFFASH